MLRTLNQDMNENLWSFFFLAKMSWDPTPSLPWRVRASQQERAMSQPPPSPPTMACAGKSAGARDEPKPPLKGEKRLIKARHKGQRLRTRQLPSGTATPKRAPHKGATHTHTQTTRRPKQDEHAPKCDE